MFNDYRIPVWKRLMSFNKLLIRVFINKNINMLTANIFQYIKMSSYKD